MDLILQWIDLVWLPVGLFVVHKGHRLLAGGYFIACALMLRLQVELMQSIGYPTGILTLMKSDLFIRGIVVYAVFNAGYLLIAYFSPGSDKTVFLAASLTIFFSAMFSSTIIMLL